MAGKLLMADCRVLTRCVLGLPVLLSAALSAAASAQEIASPVPDPGARIVHAPFTEDGPLFHLVAPNPSVQLGVGPGLQAGADHVAAQQCLDGGWGWPHDDCSTTYNNITGPISLGLLEVYAQTSNCFLLEAAVAGGDFDLAFAYPNTEPRFGTFGAYFLWQLSLATGDSTYADHAAVWFFDELTAATYGPSDYDTAGWIGAVQAGRTGTWVNLRPWEFNNLIPAAAAIGNAGQAGLFTDACRDGLDTLDNTAPGSVYSDILGLAGGVRGLAFAGATSFTAINSPNHAGINGISTLQDLADYLASLQNADGSWYWHSNLGGPTESDKDTQTTAYAILALLQADPLVASDYSTNIAKGRDWLRSMQLVDGGFMSYPGGGENTEVEGEALSALAPDSCSSNVLEFLLASGSQCVKPGDPITVELHQRDLGQLVRGFQAFAQFDSAMMTFGSGTYTAAPFGLPTISPITAAGDNIDMASGIDNVFGSQTPTMADALLVTLTFTAGATEGPTTVSFRTHAPPSRFSDEFGAEVIPCLVESPTIVIDGTAPVLSLPSDTLIECDASSGPGDTGYATATDNLDCSPVITYSDAITAGACANAYTITRTWVATDCAGNASSADQAITVQDTTMPMILCPPDVTIECDESTDPMDTGLNLWMTFDTNPTLSATQAPGVWYTDRYAPAGFVSAFFDGDNRLLHSIDAADGANSRPPAFSSAFYNTQGRKYDLAPGTTRMTIDLYVPGSWATTGERMAGFWGTAFDAGASVSDFPIIEFTSTDGTPRFRGWLSDPGAWIDMGLPSGFTYDNWYTLEIELVGSTWVYTVGDLQLTVASFGSIEIGNVILQGHNTTAGVTYDIYWDNFTAAQTAIGLDNCDPAPVISYSDVEDYSACGLYTGTITRTWTATDACGNSESCVQTITVVDTTPPLLFCPADVTVSCEDSIDPMDLGMPSYFQGFEDDTFGWFDFGGTLTRVASGTGGVTSADGGWHAETDGAFTRWGGYSSVFPAGGYRTSVDVYLDVSLGLANDSRMDYTSAINTPAGSHRRDFAVAIGFYNSADVTGPGAGTDRFVMSFSNNTPGWPKNPARDPFAVDVTGWYTLEHHFYDGGGGVLACDLNLYDSGGTLLHSWTLSDPTDIIGSTVGGNRYGWFLNMDWTLPIDNTFIDTGSALAFDSCDPAPTVTYSDSFVSGCSAYAGVVTRTWSAMDACGNTETCDQIITLTDTTPPTITCPPDVSVVADAGECTALVSPGSPTALDNCDPSPVITFSRSDGALSLSDPYDSADSPITITWTATDACGNADSCDQTITVAAVNEVVVDVALSPTVSTPLTRCITFELYECGGPSAYVVEQELTFTGGVASAVLEVPCGVYDCITARDALHTLSRTIDPLPISGTQYVADFVTPGKDLIGGNLNDDLFIDILDFGTFSMQFGTNFGTGDTTCATVAPHSDISGNGIVGTEDFTFIANNFLDMSDVNCCGLLRDPGHGTEPITEISLAELRRMGLGHLSAGDLNGDGWLDQLDIAAFLNGARPGIAPAPQQPDSIRPKRR